MGLNTCMTMAKVSGMFPVSAELGRKVQEEHLLVCLKGKDETQ